MRPTDERGRPIGASPGGLPAGLRGGRAASAEAGFDIGLHRPCTNWHFVLSVVEKPSSKVSLVYRAYCGLFETEIVLHWF